MSLTPTPLTRTCSAPEAHEVVVDDYHGTQVADPYRWLEDGESAEVCAWTDEQNARTRAVLDAIPGRERLHRRLSELLKVGTLSAPAVRVTRCGEARYFHFRREGEQEQGVFYVREGESGADRPLIDLQAMTADTTAAIAWTSPSPDGSMVAWGRSDGGSEESVLHVRVVDSGKDLPDTIPHTRFASIAWLPDSRGFFYTRYPEPGTVPKGDEKYYRRVFLHRLGDDPNTDELVFPDPRDRRMAYEKTASPSVSLSPNGRWLVVRVHQGAQKSEVYFLDTSAGASAEWVGVATKTDAAFRAIPHDGTLYVLTNDGALRSRLFAVDYARPQRPAWRAVIPEGADVLRSVTVIGDVIVANYLHEAATRLERFSLDGRPLGPLALPSAGSATVHGRHDGGEAFVRFTSFVEPGRVIRFNLKTGEASTWGRVGAALALEGVTVSHAHARSKDGTRVPMFVVERAGAVRDGDNPTIMYGYGGFNQCASPAYNPSALAAVERGSVWVLAVLRGGGEFGDAWHRAGMLENKQNVFDDFIACAEELCHAGVTSPSRLGIIGSSNGGLLTAAVVTQRPDLFRAAVSDVPLTDMLRYQHFRIAKLWVSEYGASDDPAQFRTLFAYSPYHRVHDGTVYPSMLFVTAESDTRVDPMHARKMAARMQEAQPPSARERPILLRVESEAGHGAGKPIPKLADELTDELSFLLDALGCDLSTPEGDARPRPA
jgi:prolyl oligopeptidase